MKLKLVQNGILFIGVKTLEIDKLDLIDYVFDYVYSSLFQREGTISLPPLKDERWAGVENDHVQVHPTIFWEEYVITQANFYIFRSIKKAA